MADDDIKDENEDAEDKVGGAEGEVQFDEDGNPIPSEAKGSNKRKFIIVIAAVVVLLAALIGGLFFTGVIGGGEAIPEGAHQVVNEHGETKDTSHAAPSDGHGGGHGDKTESGFLEVPPMVVNLNTEDGSPRFLRLTVQLELEDADDKEAVAAILPRVIDQFQTYLRELRVQDLRGSAGIYRLQMELLWRVNQAAAPAQIKDILFQEILIQ